MRKKYYLLLFAFCCCMQVFPQQFRVRYTASALNQPFTGHVIAYLSKENKTPKEAMAGVEVFPCFLIYVENIRPGTDVLIDDKAISYPIPLTGIERGEYYVQIVWDRNLGGRSIAMSPGNVYNKTQKVDFTANPARVFPIVCDHVVKAQGFIETAFVKELKAPSDLLSDFHKKPMTVDAAVILPKEYPGDPGRKFPVLFLVSGYGGDYHRFSGDTTISSDPIDTSACITVFLDGNCSLGHSVYANSDNNGPWGDALTREFIPLLEKKYRCNGARFLRGHSSGGWTVLWLQTHYPKVFAGCASSSPDPVDFRSFQKVNLYEEKNIFYDKDSTLWLAGTIAGRFPWITMKNMYRMENVIYRGEQMHSFDAVFGKKGKNGMPVTLCNAVTGAIDPDAFSHWQQYDISRYLRNNWESIKADLEGKVRISVGLQDNFLLNYAVVMLEGEMKKLPANFEFAYYPGDHFTVSTPDYRKDIVRFLQKKYQEWLAKNRSTSYQFPRKDD